MICPPPFPLSGHAVNSLNWPRHAPDHPRGGGVRPFRPSGTPLQTERYAPSYIRCSGELRSNNPHRTNKRLDRPPARPPARPLATGTGYPRGLRSVGSDLLWCGKVCPGAVRVCPGTACAVWVLPGLFRSVLQVCQGLLGLVMVNGFLGVYRVIGLSRSVDGLLGLRVCKVCTESGRYHSESVCLGSPGA